MGLFNRFKKHDEEKKKIKNTEIAQQDNSLLSMSNIMLMKTRVELTKEN